MAAGSTDSNGGGGAVPGDTSTPDADADAQDAGGAGEMDSAKTENAAELSSAARSGASALPRAIVEAEEAKASQTQAESQQTQAKKFYVYQGISNNVVDNAKVLDYENPLAPFVLPVAILILVIGAVQSIWWYLRQRRPTDTDAPHRSATPLAPA